MDIVKTMNKVLYTMAIVSLLATPVSAKNLHKEKWYQEKYCRGKVGVALPDQKTQRAQCDCLTDTHSIEYEFAKDFYASIGQSLYYSLQTGKRAGVALILESEKDRKYWLKLNSTIKLFNLPIDTWEIWP